MNLNHMNPTIAIFAKVGLERGKRGINNAKSYNKILLLQKRTLA